MEQYDSKVGVSPRLSCHVPGHPLSNMVSLVASLKDIADTIESRYLAPQLPLSTPAFPNSSTVAHVRQLFLQSQHPYLASPLLLVNSITKSSFQRGCRPMVGSTRPDGYHCIDASS